MTDSNPALSLAPSGLLPPDPDYDLDALEARREHWCTLRMRDGLCIRLGRFRQRNADTPVLLVHGASAGSRTFMVPDGGIIRYLADRGFDVWTLDWRGSNQFRAFNPKEERKHVVQTGNTPYWAHFNLDAAAEFDLLGALSAIGAWLKRESGEDVPAISVLGHCVGGAIVSQALATGLLTGARTFRIRAVVLTTLALFYRVGVEGWLKGNEFLLEQLTTELDTFAEPDHPVINPVSGKLEGWPDTLEKAFGRWRVSVLAPNGWGGNAPEFVERIAFMYGMPYHTRRLAKSLTPTALQLQFGDMPLGVYLQCVRNLRLGYAAPFHPEVEVNFIRSEHIIRDGVPAFPWTLITGADNQVWHRDSIDRMYEWLVNQTRPHARKLLHKRVLPKFAHQDLYWSDESSSDVYPEIERGLLYHAFRG